jgi:hypothetical protein
MLMGNKMPRVGRWQEKEDWEGFGLNNYRGRNPNSLKRSDDPEERAWYYKGQRKEWLEYFPFENKIAVRGYLQVWENFQKELQKVILENRGKFPTRSWLYDKKYYGLINSIYKYYSSLSAVRTKLEQEGILQPRENDKQKLENLLESYVNEE